MDVKTFQRTGLVFYRLRVREKNKKNYTWLNPRNINNKNGANIFIILARFVEKTLNSMTEWDEIDNYTFRFASFNAMNGEKSQGANVNEDTTSVSGTIEFGTGHQTSMKILDKQTGTTSKKPIGHTINLPYFFSLTLHPSENEVWLCLEQKGNSTTKPVFNKFSRFFSDLFAHFIIETERSAPSSYIKEVMNDGRCTTVSLYYSEHAHDPITNLNLQKLNEKNFTIKTVIIFDDKPPIKDIPDLMYFKENSGCDAASITIEFKKRKISLMNDQDHADTPAIDITDEIKDYRDADNHPRFPDILRISNLYLSYIFDPSI